MAENLSLQKERLTARLDKLTDIFADGHIDEQTFLRRKETLLHQLQPLKQKLEDSEATAIEQESTIREKLELAMSALSLYRAADWPNRRNLVQTVTSNRYVRGKNLELVLSQPFGEIAKRVPVHCGGPQGSRTAAMDLLLALLQTILPLYPFPHAAIQGANSRVQGDLEERVRRRDLRRGRPRARRTGPGTILHSGPVEWPTRQSQLGTSV
jgi:hypothetical protein